MQLVVKPFVRVCLALVCAVAAGLLAAPRARAEAPGDGDGGGGLVREEVSFRGGGGLVLHGTVLAAPGARGNRPGIVLVGGSGPGPRQEYRQEAEAFARAGITTLVYDKRTAGYSVTHRDFGVLAEDALGGVGLLRQWKGVDPHQVGLWGFSEGAWAAPLAASRSSEVAFVITIGGSGYDALRTQTWNLTTHLLHRGAGASFTGVVAGPAAQLLQATGKFPGADYDAAQVLGRLHRTPVLALWGAHDMQVPPAESARVFQQALRRAGNPHAVIRFVPGGAHNGHRTSDGFDRLGGPLFHGKPLGELAPGYGETMTSWVRAVAAGCPPVSAVAPAPPQMASSTPVPGDAWYAWLVPLLLLVGFAGYPVGAVLRRGPVVRPVRRLAGLGLVAVVGAVVCPFVVYVVGDGVAVPGVWGRPVVWLAVQLVGVAVIVAGVAAVVAVWRRRREWGVGAWLRPAPVLLAGVGFVPWGVWWGVFRV
ncbi:prolyl oligopeptidase family serine peptidase [Streptomyces sp. NPDC001793]|uniref:alpha/beta hydrolase family protein n=1 Tax=Streptomyces sp. NPDC001793 TaxID=3154657 RepID=UPI0033278B40